MSDGSQALNETLVLPGLDSDVRGKVAANEVPVAGLNLKRPLVSFDLETTGLDVKEDRIVEICCVKIHPDGRREVQTLRVNPEVPIGPEAEQVHGISAEDLKDAPSWAEVAPSIHAFVAGCDLTGFNLEHFDLPMLTREMGRAGLEFPEDGCEVVDARRLYMLKEPRDLSTAYQYYCGKTLEGAHSAEADAVAAAEVLLAQVARYDDVPTDLSELADFCHPDRKRWLDREGKVMWKDGAPVLTFGKYRGRPLPQVVKEDPDYLRWVASADFAPAVQRIVADALKGTLPPVPEGPSD